MGSCWICYCFARGRFSWYWWWQLARWKFGRQLKTSTNCQNITGFEESNAGVRIFTRSWDVAISVPVQRKYDKLSLNSTLTTTTVLWPFFWDHTGEPVPEENFWTLWFKGRLTEADTPTIWLGATPAGLTSAHLHHPPYFLTGRMPFLPSNQQRQSTEGN